MSEKTAIIQAERERLAKELEAKMAEPFYKNRPDARMTMAVAASVVRRGRRLIAIEQLQNLEDLLAEADDLPTASPDIAPSKESRA